MAGQSESTYSPQPHAQTKLATLESPQTHLQIPNIENMTNSAISTPHDDTVSSDPRLNQPYVPRVTTNFKRVRRYPLPKYVHLPPDPLPYFRSDKKS